MAIGNSWPVPVATAIVKARSQFEHRGKLWKLALLPGALSRAGVVHKALMTRWGENADVILWGTCDMHAESLQKTKIAVWRTIHLSLDMI